MPEESSRKKPSSGDEAKSDHSSFDVGTRVEVDCNGTWKAANITHVHRNGEYSVKFEATDQVEKHVNKDRVRRSKNAKAKDKDKDDDHDSGRDNTKSRSKSKRSKHQRGKDNDDDDDDENDATTTQDFEVGNEVFYLVRRQDTSATTTTRDNAASAKWSLGRIESFRSDRTQVDLTNVNTKEVVKKVPVKDLRKARKHLNKDTNVEPDTYVMYLEPGSDTKDWSAGFVVKSHSKDQTLDIAHESDEDHVDKRVPKKNVRLGDPNLATSKAKSKKTPKHKSSEDNESDSGNDNEFQANNLKLEIGQRVTFMDDRHVQHNGKIRQLRTEDKQADIEHDSDSEQVTKRVAFADIKPVSALGRLLPTGPSFFAGTGLGQPQIIDTNTRVLVTTRGSGDNNQPGTKTKGIVVKKWKDGTFDVRTVDGQLLKRVDRSKLTVLTLTALLFGGIQMNMPKWSLFSGTTFTVGQQVRFRNPKTSHRSSSRTLVDGVVVRVKKNNQYVVEYKDEDGSSAETTLEGHEMEATSTPLSTVLDALIPNTTVFQVGSFVEVTKNQQVHQAMIVAVNDDGSYAVEYADGKKDTKVKPDRLRLCLRRLRIGTEVEFVIEGPCKEVSKLEGEVAWVHRDEKVAVRVNGGNDIFAEVSSHALTVNGQAASKAPVTSTWRELMAFWINMLVEFVVYAWICFGLLLELNEMIQIHRQTSPDKFQNEQVMAKMYARAAMKQTPEVMSSCLARITDQHDMLRVLENTNSTSTSTNGTLLATSFVLANADFLATERAWLLVLIVVKAICAAVSTICAMRVIHFKFGAMQDKLIDVQEYQRDRVLRRVLSQAMVVTILVCFVTLLCLTSLLNAMEYMCLFSSDNLNLFRLDAHALHVDLFDFTPDAVDTVVDLMVILASTSIFHLYRTVALYFVLFCIDTLLLRVMFMIPSVLASCLINALAMASLHIFFYVRKYSYARLNVLTLNKETNLALFQVMATLWITFTFGRVLFSIGKYLSMATERLQTTRDITDDILEQAERGEFGLQAKKEAALTKLEIDQQQLGIGKLILLQVHQRLLFHLISTVFCIVVDGGTLQSILATLDANLLLFTNVHLGICCTWLLLCLGSYLSALYIHKEFPNLPQNILKNL